MSSTTPDVTVERDIAYGPDPRNRLDAYYPPAPNGAMILQIHGGGWWQGDKSKEEGLARRFAGAGYLVVAPNYRFADGASGRAANLYPTQVGDVLRALDWAETSGLRFKRFGAFGGSSGGNLAFEVAIARGAPAASWSGLLDLAGFMARHGDAAPHQVMIDEAAPGAAIDQGGADPGYYKWLLFNLLGPDLEKLVEATPIRRISQTTGPVLLANSMAELVPKEEPLLAASALVAAGVPARVLLFEGARHATGYLEDALEETLRFFRHYLIG
ncbi:MAG: alpha/beta hydrolase [Bifidobacteriaceae bacterium]|jgi:acetyl esterase/lipase|nr:alpha/beta hydrolase [Bifidobacteriaceae bacterium]